MIDYMNPKVRVIEQSEKYAKDTVRLMVAAALCGIKEVGGMIIAQKLDIAGQPDMPASAMASGCVDFVLSPEDIVKEIVRNARAVG